MPSAIFLTGLPDPVGLQVGPTKLFVIVFFGVWYQILRRNRHIGC